MKITNKIKKEYIRKKLKEDDVWVKRGLKKIFDNQTDDEQNVEMTKHHNEIGFNGHDAPLLSSFAKQLINKNWLSHKQMHILHKMMPKYWRQIFELCDKTKLEESIKKEIGAVQLELAG